MVNSSDFDDTDTEAAITVPVTALNSITNKNKPLQFVAFNDDILFRVFLLLALFMSCLHTQSVIQSVSQSVS